MITTQYHDEAPCRTPFQILSALRSKPQLFAAWLSIWETTPMFRTLI